MSLWFWLRPSLRRRAEGNRPACRHTRVRLRLEVLEDRLAPATFPVTNVNDSGSGSLRQAILKANGTVGGARSPLTLPAAASISFNALAENHRPGGHQGRVPARLIATPSTLELGPAAVIADRSESEERRMKNERARRA
jgi:hypothetical protein